MPTTFKSTDGGAVESIQSNNELRPNLRLTRVLSWLNAKRLKQQFMEREEYRHNKYLAAWKIGACNVPFLEMGKGDFEAAARKAEENKKILNAFVSPEDYLELESDSRKLRNHNSFFNGEESTRMQIFIQLLQSDPDLEPFLKYLKLSTDADLGFYYKGHEDYLIPEIKVMRNTEDEKLSAMCDALLQKSQELMKSRAGDPSVTICKPPQPAQEQIDSIEKELENSSQKLLVETCSGCHSSDSKRKYYIPFEDPKMLHKAFQENPYFYQDMVDRVKSSGPGKMPKNRDLSDEERKIILQYLDSIK